MASMSVSCRIPSCVSNGKRVPEPSSSSSMSSMWLTHTTLKPNQHHQHHHNLKVKSLSLDFSSSLFEGGFDDEPPSSTPPPPPLPGLAAAEDKPQPQCPPGLRQYETMAVLRPDMSEDDRLSLTNNYEELLVAGGAMYVEVFNRGVIPLAYSIKKKNKAGETNTYLDGIYLLFTYFTKPESISALEAALQTDDDVIRSSSFKIRKRKY